MKLTFVTWGFLVIVVRRRVCLIYIPDGSSNFLTAGDALTLKEVRDCALKSCFRRQLLSVVITAFPEKRSD